MALPLFQFLNNSVVEPRIKLNKSNKFDMEQGEYDNRLFILPQRSKMLPFFLKFRAHYIYTVF